MDAAVTDRLPCGLTLSQHIHTHLRPKPYEQSIVRKFQRGVHGWCMAKFDVEIAFLGRFMGVTRTNSQRRFGLRGKTHLWASCVGEADRVYPSDSGHCRRARWADLRRHERQGLVRPAQGLVMLLPTFQSISSPLGHTLDTAPSRGHSCTMVKGFRRS